MLCVAHMHSLFHHIIPLFSWPRLISNNTQISGISQHIQVTGGYFRSVLYFVHTSWWLCCKPKNLWTGTSKPLETTQDFRDHPSPEPTKPSETIQALNQPSPQRPSKSWTNQAFRDHPSPEPTNPSETIQALNQPSLQRPSKPWTN